ncbi:MULTISPECIES: Gfo/Idh/MocA family protein [unclassified Nesterenkonia]|uniref:Gfo/Idh/MocA family protein n=1 Tax=unclassified Nesterenkonia TaxID=2629769 RepID=UPI001F4CD060|nr:MULTISPECIES: Gfo/Idh/MocA family oxidoreductase [unclassified Nesterenkonia]MCH8560951.1 Gfo/Idh/MocA family oxidoreductase [Nesterenkonia sp. DZ6]MCH8571031.1 Gfo/Idh/MocA family oxidoreductase [Nesterenkonia sp. AY15]
MAELEKPRLGVAMIGHAFMGRVHSQAWRSASRFFDLPMEPRMRVLVGRDAQRSKQAAQRLGWVESATDWRRVLERKDVDLIDICTPGDTHAEIAAAALEAGKHVLVEKPMANSVAEAERMNDAAHRARAQGIHAMVGFTYRRVPALKLAQELIAEGRIGEVRQVRAQYLQDWLGDETAPLSWRLDKARAGSGALGDIGAHIVDLTCFLTGQRFAGVSGMLDTIVAERPVAAAAAVAAGGIGGGSGGLGGGPGASAEASGTAARGPVTVDDAALVTARLSSGAPVILEASRFAWGRKNALRIEVSGSRGAVSFDFEDMNVLHYYDATQPARTAGFTRIMATEPEHPYLEAWWPAGHGLGYEHGFTHQVVDLVRGIAAGKDPRPSFEDGLHVQRVLEAVERSSGAAHQWTEIHDHERR